LRSLNFAARRFYSTATNSFGGSQTSSLVTATPLARHQTWATGQALYALAHAGVTADEPVIQRGHAFLIETQRDDGSWPMTSRPTKPGGEGAKYLIPITGAGSAWAVLGLVRSR
jgi:hypothetical protein